MNPNRSLYFASLVGAIAGLLSWGASTLLQIALGVRGEQWISDTMVVCALGAALASCLFSYMDYASGKRARWINLAWGLLFGLGSAAIAALLIYELQVNIQLQSPVLFRLVVWALAGSLIAFGIGLRWVRGNRVRLLHTYSGGLLGGLAGGAIFTFLGRYSPELCQACGLMITGVGTGFGAALAPILVRDGAVEFISSGDARAQSKFGRKGKCWLLEPGESYILGSMANSDFNNRSKQGVEISVPDSSLSPRHAVFFAKEGRYFIARHPDAGGPAGIAKYILRVRGKTVTTSQEIHASDDILAGRTAFRFISREIH